jgi:hypothetical protein
MVAAPQNQWSLSIVIISLVIFIVGYFLMLILSTGLSKDPIIIAKATITYAAIPQEVSFFLHHSVKGPTFCSTSVVVGIKAPKNMAATAPQLLACFQ